MTTRLAKEALLKKIANRWAIAVICTLLMANLGTVYAWSFFQIPLGDTYNWSNSEVAWAFSLAICFLGLAAAVGGMVLPRTGPMVLTVLGGMLFGSGYLLAALALWTHALPLLHVGYGIIGGTGLGLAYVTPVATVARWFPDRKGFATGMVVMGFGFGALLMSKVIAPLLLSLMGGDLIKVFTVTGILFLLVTVPTGALVRNPPPGWLPEGEPPAKTMAGLATGAGTVTVGNCLLSRNFLLLWLVFFCNIAAGISIIGFQSPLFQDICSRTNPALSRETLAGYGATLIAVSAVFNGVGRFFWGSISDRIGRRVTFQCILGTQLLAFLQLVYTDSPWLFATLVCYILLCYGGGFGTMPSFVLDLFGGRVMPAVYGAMLTAWSAAGIAGPQLVAMIKDRYPSHLYPGRASSYSFALAGILLLMGFILSFMLKSRRQID